MAAGMNFAQNTWSQVFKKKTENESEETSFSISCPFGGTAVHFRNRCFIRLVLLATKKSQLLPCMQGRKEFTYKTSLRMIKIASNNRDRCRYTCFQKQVSFRVPAVRKDTDCVTEGEAPVKRARVLPQASPSQSQVTTSLQESCVPTLRTITGPPALASEQTKLHFQGHPSQHCS